MAKVSIWAYGSGFAVGVLLSSAFVILLVILFARAFAAVAKPCRAVANKLP
jgi:hypothetical protein